MNPTFKFHPIHFNWVAIHPQPIGVVYFIGGAFFGTFPTIFYRYLLKQLFNQGYTIIAFPFRFSFRHWSVSINLVKDLSELRQKIAIEAQRLGYEAKIYEEEPTSEVPNYFWLAHSLGSKYVALLEVLTELEGKPIQEILNNCVGLNQYRQIETSLRGVDFKNISLKNQPSVLMAPLIAGLESAVPIPILPGLIKKVFSLDVQPDVKQTRCLIQKSQLFNLTALIAFGNDKIASNPAKDKEGEIQGTIEWLKHYLSLKKITELSGRRHLAPLGFRNGDQLLATETIESLRILTQTLEKASSGENKSLLVVNQ